MILQSKRVNMQTAEIKIEMMATKQYLSGSRPTIRALYVHTHARLFDGGARVPGSQVLVPYYESPYFESPPLFVPDMHEDPQSPGEKREAGRE